MVTAMLEEVHVRSSPNVLGSCPVAQNSSIAALAMSAHFDCACQWSYPSNVDANLLIVPQSAFGVGKSASVRLALLISHMRDCFRYALLLSCARTRIPQAQQQCPSLGPCGNTIPDEKCPCSGKCGFRRGRRRRKMSPRPCRRPLGDSVMVQIRGDAWRAKMCPASIWTFGIVGCRRTAILSCPTVIIPARCHRTRCSHNPGKFACVGSVAGPFRGASNSHVRGDPDFTPAETRLQASSYLSGIGLAVSNFTTMS